MSRLEQLVKEMFVILDKIEMSYEGKEIHTTTIDSCSIMDKVKLDSILGEMRFGLKLNTPPKLRTRSEIEPGICPWCNGTGDTQNHERESWDCRLCDRSGHVKPCPDCNGKVSDNCKVCNGIGLVANKDW